MQAVVVEHRAKLSTISAKLPAMEQEKKVAAAARNFKEAGRVSKEIKALQALKEELEAELETASDKLDACKTSLSEKQATQRNKQSDLEQRRRAIENTRFLAIRQVDVILRGVADNQ